MTVQTALGQGRRLLEDAQVAVPRLTAEVLLAHALRRERVWLYAHPEEELSDVARIHYGRYLNERMDGKPTQYITGRQEFYGREFKVNCDVLIPRPETEHLVETMVPLLGPGSRIVDAGTGSGAIAITLALETGCGAIATDISEAALRVAARNAARLGATALVHPVCGDLLAAVARASVDAVVSNPPYVDPEDRSTIQREVRDWEPDVALYSDEAGFGAYRRLVADAPRVLRSGGWLAFELGYRSLEPVRAMLDPRVWGEVEVTSDLQGLPRVLRARRML
jgi:release factor glutamine methyltransferase